MLLHTSSADSFEGDGNNEYISFEPRRAGREYVGIGLTLLSVSFCCKCKSYHCCFVQVLMLISLAHVKKRMVKQWLVLVGPTTCQTNIEILHTEFVLELSADFCYTT